jgi:hypothetical protein
MVLAASAEAWKNRLEVEPSLKHVVNAFAIVAYFCFSFAVGRMNYYRVKAFR